MFNLETNELCLFIAMMLVFWICVKLQKKKIEEQDKHIKKLTTELTESRKKIVDLETSIWALEEQRDMFEETLTRAGITPDVWNTEDKINGG